MRLDRFTEKAQEALQEAAELAGGLGQQAIEPEHLLLALVRQPEGVGRTLLERAGVSVQALEPALVSTVERFPKVSGGGQPYISPSLNKALEQADKKPRSSRTSTSRLSTSSLRWPTAKRCRTLAPSTTPCLGRCARSVAASGSPTRIPSPSTRPSRNTAAT
jgi:ATP-dependent Clp protease ATP-binding subunit ClpA